MRRRRWATTRQSPIACCSAPGSFRSGLERQSRSRRRRSRCRTCPADGSCSAWARRVHRSSRGCTGFRSRDPLSRLRETVEIVRQVVGGEKISYPGREFRIPCGRRRRVPMRLSMRAEHPIPIYLATLSPAMLRLTGEIADGWLGTSFVPEGAGRLLHSLDEGLARSGRSRADLDICQGAEVAFAPDEDALRRWSAAARRNSPSAWAGWDRRRPTSTTRPIAVKAGPTSPREVRERWQAGDRDGAAGLVTDEMVLATTLDRHRIHGAATIVGVARRGGRHRAALSGRRHARRPAVHLGQGNRDRPRHQ